MIDLIDLSKHLERLMDGFFKEKAVIVKSLNDLQKEPTYWRLKAENHNLAWMRKEVRQRSNRRGWSPVIVFDKYGRRAVFTDTKNKLVLMHKEPEKKPAPRLSAIPLYL